MGKNIKKILQMFNNRVYVVFFGVCILFLIILGKFYQLQIVEHATYANNLRASVERNIEIPATRGNIYDRYGRPLAINNATNVLKFDQQVPLKRGELNKILLDVANVLQKNGDQYIDNVPITKEPPFEYTGTKTAINQFMYSVPYNNAQHREELLKLSASELIEYFRDAKIFAIDESYTDEEARKIIAMRLEIHPYTYRKYNLVTLATNISEKTVTELEENHADYPGIGVDVEPARYYPEGEILGNILGYTRAITDAQYEELKDQGYDQNDIVGHEGIEKSMEEELRGVKGMERVEVDNLGRRVHTIEKQDAVAGNDVYLTIDLDLQRTAYESVEQRLSEAIIQRLRGTTRGVDPLESKEIIISMIESSQINLDQMKNADEGSIQSELYTRLMDAYNELDEVIQETLTPIDLLIQNLDEDTDLFTEKEILRVFHEQGRILLPESTINAFINNRYGSTGSVLIDQLSKGYLRPNQFSIDPFSGSAVVVDVNNGEVLALVGYPSYDSNQMTTNFNSYYNSLFDERSMLWNRSVMTKEAPGSLFKMITSIAGLEEGVVTPTQPIYCNGVFEKAGTPHPACWIHNMTGGRHGNMDAEGALEVSCNIYMFEVAYRLGFLSDEPYYAIDTLTKYAEMFGLGEPTGVEIAEAAPNVSSPKNLVRNQMSNVLSNIRNLTDERLARYTGDVITLLEKGIYPISSGLEDDLDSQIDYLTQYEVKRNIEPLLQESFEDELQLLLETVYSILQEELSHSLSSVLNTLVENAMNDDSGKSLRITVRDELIIQLRNMIGESIDPLIEQIIEDMDVYDILDAYDYGYDVIYNRELKKDPESELVKELRRRLENIDEEEAFYKEHLAGKVYESMLLAIANDCLDGLELEWTDGTTVRTAIGQGSNAFTPLQLARYMAGLANGEVVYDMRLISGIFDNKDDDTYEPKESELFGTLDISPSTIEVVHQGMYDVTHGSAGSARNEFRNYDIKIAGKTGTAQKGTQEHAWFSGFAPYEDPQVAFVTAMYYADSLGSFTRLIARDVLTDYFELEEEHSKTTLEHTFIE